MLARMIPTASLVLVAMAAACTSSKTECDCVAPLATLRVPQESAAAVTSVNLSGPACDGATARCVQNTATGCATYSFEAKVAGSCSVDVLFVDGTFHASLTFEQTSGCCAGLYPTPVSAGDIEVVHLQGDAGGAG